MSEQKRPHICPTYLSKPSSRLRRRQLVCLFILFIIVTLISSLLYTLQNKFVTETGHRTWDIEPCTNLMLNMSTKGPIKADTKTIPNMVDLEDTLGPFLSLGGHFRPSSCRPEQKVAIIVPYRDRLFHLMMFLRHMHPFLQRQSVEYGIFVVEQEGEIPFNRAMLMNIGFVEATKLDRYDCFVFHDVDLLPLDDRNFYQCIDEPVHLSASIDAHNYTLMYNTIFGGASMLNKDMMKKVNGFSNLYFGWGGEDDDMSYRVRSHTMMIVRYIPEVAKYTMLRHARADKEDRTKLFFTSRIRIHEDGLNSLKYQLLDLKLFPLYTWIFVHINQTEVMEAHKHLLEGVHKIVAR